MAAPGHRHVRVGEVVLEVVGEEAEVHRDARHDAAKVATQQRAVVARLDLRELLDARLDAVGDVAQQRRALRDRHAGPCRKGLARSSDGSVDLGLGACADLADDALVDRGDVGERRTVSAGDALATDPVTRIDLDPLDGDLLGLRRGDHDAPRKVGWCGDAHHTTNRSGPNGHRAAR